MDAYEATRIVFSRIQTLDPENAAKIMGLLLIQDHSEKEMIRLAFGPEALLHSLILKARKDLNLLPHSPSSASSNPFQRQNRAPPPPLSINSPSWAPPQPDLFSPEDEFLNEQMYDGSSTHHRRSYSDFDAAGFGWKPCLYYARGFCKNGNACRFLHGMPEDGSGMSNIEQELMFMRSKSQRLGSAASMCFPYSPTGSLGPMSPSSSSFLFQQEKQRAATAAAAAAMMLGGDDGYKFMSPRTDPGARQIYLTFPADSTFREEDVSNYFSIYGPVQDVRIPYQQKRMFGFVTFLYPETVKLILAKGNPHFVCDARVLVKPYKEKGKIAEKKLQAERGDFSGGNTPTGFDTRDPFDFQQLGPRLMYGNSNQEMMLRRKLEEQMQAAELQQAIEMQGRRFMGLQLLDFKNRSMSTSTTISSRTNDISHDGSPTEEKSPSPVMLSAVNAAAVGADKDETAETGREVTTKSNEDSDFQESTEHNLPDSPFASPTKASPFVNGPFSVQSASVLDSEFLNVNGSHIIDSSPSSALDMASFKSCFFQMPRFSSGHGAVGL